MCRFFGLPCSLNFDILWPVTPVWIIYQITIHFVRIPCYYPIEILQREQHINHSIKNLKNTVELHRQCNLRRYIRPLHILVVTRRYCPDPKSSWHCHRRNVMALPRIRVTWTTLWIGQSRVDYSTWSRTGAAAAEASATTILARRSKYVWDDFVNAISEICSWDYPCCHGKEDFEIFFDKTDDNC